MMLMNPFRFGFVRTLVTGILLPGLLLSPAVAQVFDSNSVEPVAQNSTTFNAPAGMTQQPGATQPRVMPSVVMQPGEMSHRETQAAEVQMDRLQWGADAVKRSRQSDPDLPLSRREGLRNEVSQFQWFVKQATGLELNIFGAQLFTDSNTYQPISNVAPPSNYAVGPGDQIQLQVWGAIDLNIELTVDKRGVLTVPKVGPLSVAGMKVGQLDAALQAHVGKVFRNVQVAATVAKLRNIQVYVVGQAKRPGTYTLSSLSTLVNALFVSGGPSAYGSMRNIEVRRDNQTISQLDLYDFILKGERKGDVTLQAGDVIVINPVGPQVALTGALDHAAIYELNGATSLGDLLKSFGGVPVLSQVRGATLERVVPGQTPPRQVQQIALNPIGLATTLVDADIVDLKPITLGFSNEVTLRGPVSNPGRVAWFEGMRVSDLIPSAQSLIDPEYFSQKAGVRENKVENIDAASSQVRSGFSAINWDYSVIERLDKVALKNQLIPFDLGAAVLRGEPNSNLLLQPGDVVTVFNQKDLRLPEEKQFRLVKVEGEVAAPGVYNAKPGETLPQLIRRIGGLSAQAYLFGTEFTRESVRKQQQVNLDRLVAQLESSLSVQTDQLAANSGTPLTEARLLAQQAAQKKAKEAQLTRLKAMSSNGRIALELTPAASELASLPNIPLEDGDRVFVPATPSFVAALGAVSNQNVIVYRPERTVGDLMRLAGLTESADSSRAFILRADGTVMSGYESGFWASSSFEQETLAPGDTLVVPPKLDQETTWSTFIRNSIDITQILSNLGLGLAALRSL